MFPRRPLRALNAAERHWVPQCFLPSAAAGYGVPPSATARRRAPAAERHHVPKPALPRATMLRAAEHRRAAAGAGRRRAPLNATERRKSLLGHVLPSTAAPPRALRTAEHYGAQPSKTEKWARRYVRDRAVVAQQRAHAPRLTPPPASPPLISHRSLQVRDTEGRGGVTTEVVSRYGSRPACNPRRQGGTTSGPTSATEEVIHPWVGLGS